VGFLDLEGNVRIVFDGVFIERRVASKPVTERRELRSMFKPKSAQVLRVMLRDPGRAWRVTELAQAADVSLGHVSNVRNSLLDREWASVSDAGLHLSEPDALLDDWRDAYEPPAARRMGFYTTLHGGEFEDAARRVLRAEGEEGLGIFASFSAAHWLAPYGRTGMQYFYADEQGLERLMPILKLSPVSRAKTWSCTSSRTGVCSSTRWSRRLVLFAPVRFKPISTFPALANAGVSRLTIYDGKDSNGKNDAGRAAVRRRVRRPHHSGRQGSAG
jgi:hypothetical protein